MILRTNGRNLRRNTVRQALLSWAAVVWMSTSSEAQHFYNFIEEESGNILATLKLESLPATDIAALSFTAEGQTLLELEPKYSGTFDRIDDSQIFGDGSNGLVCNFGDDRCGWIDFDPPIGFAYAEWPGNFAIMIGEEADEPDRLGARAKYFPFISLATGSFQRVQIPEPSSALLLMSAIFFGLGAMGHGRLRK